ncbi:hypothetical protein ACIQGZ_19015 [Streptomyces sp. NPDC092296]|uniref:hypothetical protein n=1 Tax=Streptomyces sp. NPDC092296 TaxID=3366012 RepID=UPI003820B216
MSKRIARAAAIVTLAVASSVVSLAGTASANPESSYSYRGGGHDDCNEGHGRHEEGRRHEERRDIRRFDSRRENFLLGNFASFGDHAVIVF